MRVGRQCSHHIVLTIDTSHIHPALPTQVLLSVGQLQSQASFMFLPHRHLFSSAIQCLSGLCCEATCLAFGTIVFRFSSPSIGFQLSRTTLRISEGIWTKLMFGGLQHTGYHDRPFFVDRGGANMAIVTSRDLSLQSIPWQLVGGCLWLAMSINGVSTTFSVFYPL